MRDIIARYESWLRIGPPLAKVDIFRARMIFVVGWAFVFLQLANLVAMTVVYERLTLDHAITVAAIAAVIAAIHLLRYSKQFAGYAGFFSLLLLVGITLSALEDRTGINSALLPLLVFGPMLNALISGPRMALGFSIAALGLLYVLHSVSAGTGSIYALDAQWYEVRSTQRLVQSGLALVLVTIIGCLASHHLFAAFRSLEEAADAAYAAERSKSAFLANMSHELRTPMNGLLGMLDLMHQNSLPEQQRQYVRTAAASGRSLVRLIDDILEFALLEAEQVTLVREPFHLESFFREIVDLQMPAAREKGLGLYLDLPDDLPPFILGDAGRLRQVLVNLAANAISYTEQGHVAIEPICRYEVLGKVALAIHVHDTGRGIKAEDRSRIFDRFEQADNALSRRFEGLGLGLAICREIVAHMGGEITVNSAPGHGSTFSVFVEMPVADITAAAAA